MKYFIIFALLLSGCTAPRFSAKIQYRNYDCEEYRMSAYGRTDLFKCDDILSKDKKETRTILNVQEVILDE